jgi:hypothetical protein
VVIFGERIPPTPNKKEAAALTRTAKVVSSTPTYTQTPTPTPTATPTLTPSETATPERPTPPPLPTLTPRPTHRARPAAEPTSGPATLTHKPGVYYEENTPTPTKVPKG